MTLISCRTLSLAWSVGRSQLNNCHDGGRGSAQLHGKLPSGLFQQAFVDARGSSLGERAPERLLVHTEGDAGEVHRSSKFRLCCPALGEHSRRDVRNRNSFSAHVVHHDVRHGPLLLLLPPRCNELGGKRDEVVLQLETELVVKDQERADMEENLSRAFSGVIAEAHARISQLTAERDKLMVDLEAKSKSGRRR